MRTFRKFRRKEERKKRTGGGGGRAEEEAEEEKMKKSLSLSSSSTASRKKKGSSSSSSASSFRVLGLSQHASIAATRRLGYNQPTPIQRRSIPLILRGRDCLIKSRTGSGKTCAYLLPLMDLLHTHSSVVGARALVIVPTRELVYQVAALVSRLFRETSLRFASLIGGTSLEKQFESLSNNPDLVIATVGRITQLVQEKVLRLSSVECLVLDEADRMFELGWGADELRVIWREVFSSSSSSSSSKAALRKEAEGGGDGRTGRRGGRNEGTQEREEEEERRREGGGQEEAEEEFLALRGRCQAIIVSATLPSRLAEFSRLGLTNPELIQLEKELTLSEHLELRFLFVRTSQKIPCLLFLLSQHASQKEQVIVFVSSRHQATFLDCFVRKLGLPSAVIYGSMDQEERVQSLSAFRKKKTLILLVTDVASRGLDIPFLPSVINFDFPSSPRLFVHRVGRTARAGRSGVGISLVTAEDLPYAIELMSFLGGRLSPLSSSSSSLSSPPCTPGLISAPQSDLPAGPLPSPSEQPRPEHELLSPSSSSPACGTRKKDVYVLGGAPASIDYFVEFCEDLIQHDEETATSSRSASAATKLYQRMRQSASRTSVERAKELLRQHGGVSRLSLLTHPAYDVASPSSSSSSSSSSLPTQTQQQDKEEEEGEREGCLFSSSSAPTALRSAGDGESHGDRQGAPGEDGETKSLPTAEASPAAFLSPSSSSSSSPSACAEKNGGSLSERDHPSKRYAVESKDLFISKLQSFRPKVGMMGSVLSASAMLAMKRKRAELEFFQSLRLSEPTRSIQAGFFSDTADEEREEEDRNVHEEDDEADKRRRLAEESQRMNSHSSDCQNEKREQSEREGGGEETDAEKKKNTEVYEKQKEGEAPDADREKKRNNLAVTGPQAEEGRKSLSPSRSIVSTGPLADGTSDEEGAGGEEKEEEEALKRRTRVYQMSKRRRRKLEKEICSQGRQSEEEKGGSVLRGFLPSFPSSSSLSKNVDVLCHTGPGVKERESSWESFFSKKTEKTDFQTGGGFYLDVTKRGGEAQKDLLLDGAVLDLLGDEEDDLKRQKHLEKQRWDPKKKKYVLMKIDSLTGHAVKRKRKPDKQEEKTSGAYRYALWCRKTKRRIQRVGEEEDAALVSSCRYTRGQSRNHAVSSDRDGPPDDEEEDGDHSDQAKSFLGLTERHKGIAEALKKGLKLTHKQKRIVKKHQAGVFSNARLEGSGRGGKRRRASSAPSTSPRGRGRAGGRGGGNLSAESLPTVDQIAKKRRRAQQIRLKQDKKKSREEARRSKEQWMRKQQSKAVHRGAKNRSLMIVKKPKNKSVRKTRVSRNPGRRRRP